MIDLHLHTNCSDGTDSPLELLNNVVKKGVKVFSVTDHETVAANEVILNELARRDYPVEFITGVEIASVFENKSVHLLCYGFDIGSSKMRALIADGVVKRKQRMEASIHHLKNVHGIVISDEDRDRVLSLDIVGKVHLAKICVEMGVAPTIGAAIEGYLDDMETRHFKTQATDVIEAVHDTGGVVCLAHPVEVCKEYGLDLISLSKFCANLRSVGLDGIEAYHSLHSKRDIVAYKWIALGKDFLVSGGSDYHGENKSVAIGQLSNCGVVPEDGELTVLNHFFGEEQ